MSENQSSDHQGQSARAAELGALSERFAELLHRHASSWSMKHEVVRVSCTLLHTRPVQGRYAYAQGMISACQKPLQDFPVSMQGRLQSQCVSVVHLLAAGLPSVDEQMLGSTLAVALLSRCPAQWGPRLLAHCLQLDLGAVELGADGQLQLQLEPGWQVVGRVAEPCLFVLCLAQAALQAQMPLDGSSHLQLLCLLCHRCAQYTRTTLLAFRVLTAWLKHCQSVGRELELAEASAVLQLVACSWESPLSGVRKENSRTLALLLEAPPSPEYSAAALLHAVLRRLSWHAKSKLLYLAVLLPKYGVVQALQDFPELAPSLAKGLYSCHLVSAVSDVYQLCLNALPDVNSWSHFFLSPVIDIVFADTDNELAQHSLLSHWLPPTLRRFPTLLTQLLSELQGQPVPPLLPLAALLHLGRREGQLASVWSQPTDPQLVRTCLQHCSEGVRKHAFAAVCKQPKGSVPLYEQDYSAVKQFLLENVTADSAPLRHSLVNSFGYFLDRINSSGLKQLDTESHPESRAHLTTLFDFLDWLHEFLISNLQPGANYQRKITSLLLYNEVLQHLLDAASKGKCIAAHAMTRQRWLFDSAASWRSLVACTHDTTEDIQRVAGQLLLRPLWQPAGQAEQRATDLLVLALRLSRSPLFYEAESSTMLVTLAAQLLNALPDQARCAPSVWAAAQRAFMNDKELMDELEGNIPPEFHKEHKMTESNVKKEAEGKTKIGEPFCDDDETIIEWSEEAKKLLQGLVVHPKHRSRSSSSSNEGDIGVLTLPGLLLWLARVQWRAVQKDVFRAASGGAPLHGALLGLSALAPHLSPAVTAAAVRLAERVTNHFLALFTSQSADASVSPSFAEMTEAIEQVLPCGHGSGDGQLSPSHQLVLSCAWLCLKACCSLASAILCQPDTPGDIAAQCFDLVYQVLTRCRHKGAIEAAGVALGAMVKCITAPQESRMCSKPLGPVSRAFPLASLPLYVLEHILSSLANISHRTSVTRRSAGIAILVHRMSVCDARPNKPLLQLCVSELLAVAELPLPHSANTQLSDLPQACALHLLCRLVQDAALRPDMAVHASTVALLCCQAFSSVAWTVRNAALQLFGALVPLLVGEKKVQDDEEETNGNIAFEEFHAHHTKLTDYLLHLLTTKQYTNLQIVPVLSLLSKLSVSGSLVSKTVHPVHEIANRLRGCFLVLLQSPFILIRRLSAKAYSRFVPLAEVINCITQLVDSVQKRHYQNENELHGLLLTLQFLTKHLWQDEEDSVKCLAVREQLNSISLKGASWFSQLIVVDLQQNVTVNSLSSSKVSSVLVLKEVIYMLIASKCSSRPQAPGVCSWAVGCVQILLQQSEEHELLNFWSDVYQCNSDEMSEEFLSALEPRLPSLSASTKSKFSAILCTCTCFTAWHRSTELLYKIYKVLLLLVPYTNVTSSSVFKAIHILNSKKEYGIFCWSISLPLVISMFAVWTQNNTELFDIDFTFLGTLVFQTFNRTSAVDFDAEVRQDGANSFVQIFCILSKLQKKHPHWQELVGCGDITDMLVQCGIAFLQDEDVAVRKAAAMFADAQMNTYACLVQLLSPECLLSIMSAQCACGVLQAILLDTAVCEALTTELASAASCSPATVTSPFDLGTSNIYKETSQVMRLAADSLAQLLRQQPLLAQLQPTPCLDAVCATVQEVLRQLAAREVTDLPQGAAAGLHTLCTQLGLEARVCTQLQQHQLAAELTCLASEVKAAVET